MKELEVFVGFGLCFFQKSMFSLCQNIREEDNTVTLCCVYRKPVDFPKVKSSFYQVALVEFEPVVPQLFV